MIEDRSAHVARLYTGWALRHLLQTRKFQNTCMGNGPAMELTTALDAAIEELAAKNPNWEAALRIEQELLNADLI
jgi:hypothetical protein